MPFDEILGHEPVVRQLRRSLEHGRLAHAYLFWGEEGLGKRLAALHLAMAVNCHHEGEDGCGKCPACLKIQRGSHPDVRVVAPETESIKVEQVRAACEALTLHPLEGRRKVLILDAAERMTASAANALLKTLEEPPGDSLLVLVAAQQGGLLPTVVSRCQELRFAPMASEALARWLQENRGMSSEDAALLADRCEGRLGLALRLSLEEVRQDEAFFKEVLMTAVRGSLGDLFRTADALVKDGRQETFIDGYSRWAHGILLSGVGAPGHVPLPVASDLLESKGLRVRAGLDLTEACQATQTALARNANQRLALESLLLKTREVFLAGPPSADFSPPKKGGEPCMAV